MQKVFRFIKKKKNLRRLSAVWLCLVIIELFCPVICDTPTSAALNSQPASVNYLKEETAETSNASISACDYQNSSEDGTTCSDECLCHATAVLSFNIINLKESFTRSESIAFSYGEPAFNSLPPPYLPPKNS